MITQNLSQMDQLVSVKLNEGLNHGLNFRNRYRVSANGFQCKYCPYRASISEISADIMGLISYPIPQNLIRCRPIFVTMVWT